MENQESHNIYTPSLLANKLNPIFNEFQPKLVYFFGSAYQGKTGPLSDIDLAVLWPKTVNAPMIKSLELQEKIKQELKENRFEVGSLNGQNISFCYVVISTGACIFGRQEDRVAYETRVLAEYLDFSYLADIYNQAFDRRIKGEN